MIEVLFRDDRGAISVDWITLTVGILLLVSMVVYTIMNDSAGYLLEEFEILNAQYEADADSVSTLSVTQDLPIKFGR